MPIPLSAPRVVPSVTIALSVHEGLDRIGREIELFSVFFLGHHIHVRLQDDPLAIFQPCRRRFADDHISGLIDDGLQAEPIPKVDQELPDLLHLTGGAGDLGDVIEVLKHILRLQAPKRLFKGTLTVGAEVGSAAGRVGTEVGGGWVG